VLFTLWKDAQATSPALGILIMFLRHMSCNALQEGTLSSLNIFKGRCMFLNCNFISAVIKSQKVKTRLKA